VYESSEDVKTRPSGHNLSYMLASYNRSVQIALYNTNGNVLKIRVSLVSFQGDETKKKKCNRQDRNAHLMAEIAHVMDPS